MLGEDGDQTSRVRLPRPHRLQPELGTEPGASCVHCGARCAGLDAEHAGAARRHRARGRAPGAGCCERRDVWQGHVSGGRGVLQRELRDLYAARWGLYPDGLRRAVRPGGGSPDGADQAGGTGGSGGGHVHEGRGLSGLLELLRRMLVPGDRRVRARAALPDEPGQLLRRPVSRPGGRVPIGEVRARGEVTRAAPVTRPRRRSSGGGRRAGR